MEVTPDQARRYAAAVRQCAPRDAFPMQHPPFPGLNTKAAGGFPKLDGNYRHREFVTSARRLGFPCAPAAAGPLRPAARQRAVLRNTKYWTASPSRRRLPPAAAWRISVRAWSPASASWPSASGPMPPTDSTSWGLPDTVCVLGLRLRSARISKTAARTRPRSCATLCQDLRGALSADSCHHVRRWPCDLPLRSRLGHGRRPCGLRFRRCGRAQTPIPAASSVDDGNLSHDIGVHVLIGGDDAGEWDVHPQRPWPLVAFRSWSVCPSG